jgi:hypothetical protein
MRKAFEVGGFIAAAVLIVFGTAAIVLGFNGRATVHSSLKQEQIVGTPDMTPQAIAKEAREAGLKGVTLPTKSVAGQAIDNGANARTFAGYMRVHALEATGGLTYSQMPRFATKDGKGTNDPTAALKSPKGQPVDNPARAVWINETALATALNASYMAEQIALFGIVVGIALLLTGLGFGVLAAAGALRSREAPIAALGRRVPSPDTGLVAPSA